MNTWVDFKALRKNLRFEKVLQHFKVEIKAKGKQHHGFCPLPTHEGKKNSQSFSANLEKGIFQCFGCGAKGNVLDFAVLMDGGNPGNGDDLRKTAVKLQKEFGLGSDTPPRNDIPPESKPTIQAVVNAPLDFELKTLDASHPYLRNRGFTAETISTFGLGYCGKGYLKGRIAIPLHDQLGQLIGYAGRIVDDKMESDEEPRYKFPGLRERKGIKYEFRKSEFVYGGHRIKEQVDDLVVVEGFPSVWWLHQHKIENVVGFMGWSCSEAQAKLIISLTKPGGRVWLMPDGDPSGERCANSALFFISPHRFVRWAKLQMKKQPTDYSAEALKKLLS